MSRPLDLEQARRFLEALAGTPEQAFTFQCFDDSKEKRAGLARIVHGTLAERAEELAELNERGAGVFVTVNQTDLKGRTAENVVALRALFIDVDDNQGRIFAIRPDIVVLSGRGLHAYWLLDAGEALEEFEAAQKHAAAYYKSDPVIHDLPRVMRVPGFFHCKGEPTMVRLAELGGVPWAA